ncbi:FecR family protein [Pedobacter sp.]|jgi:transmembrane sensor|uniref:FecR family protein n=1 Tax=Pedobacter sp. TaxID=1411316 RepID=UPI002D10425E|nr:FecR family protein [Pedobacter sp.]HWW38768.1 FecR family protein [Pedobacter sp.]
MSRNEFIKLFEKYKSGNCSPEEKEFLDNFKDDYKLEDYEWTPEMGNKAKIHEILYARLKQETFPECSPVRKLHPILRWLSVAAVLLIASLAIAFFYYRTVQVSNQEGLLVRFETRKGQKKQITLSDGTVIWLNSLSSLTYGKDFNEKTREVNLVGEAYFDVAHKTDKPFKVHTADFNINVLGTAFNVKAYPNDKTSETTLIRGLISMQPTSGNKKTITIRPSQKIMFIKNNQLKYSDHHPVIQNIIIKTYQKVRDTTIVETAWTKNNLEIFNQRFIDIKSVLERWFDVQIIFKSEEVKNYVFTGTFTNESIIEVLNALKRTGKFNYEIKEKTITISK